MLYYLYYQFLLVLGIGFHPSWQHNYGKLKNYIGGGGVHFFSLQKKKKKYSHHPWNSSVLYSKLNKASYLTELWTFYLTQYMTMLIRILLHKHKVLGSVDLTLQHLGQDFFYSCKYTQGLLSEIRQTEAVQKPCSYNLKARSIHIFVSLKMIT